MSPSVSIRLLLTQSDMRLVELAREGHERAFEALVQRYRRPLLSYCRRLLLPGERAEDALQQGLMAAWMSLQNGSHVKDVKPWLYRIVHNTALNMLRVSGYDYATLNETLRGAEAPEQDLDRRIAVREALAGLAALPEKQREALLRTAVDGQSHEEVARALGLSEGALRGLVYRARATLRTATTAITPSPAVHWALAQRTAVSAPLAARLAEMGAGGGSVGVGSLLLKGSAIVVTAGAVAGGVATVRHHSHAGAGGAQTAELVADNASVQQPASVSGISAPDQSAGARPVHDYRRFGVGRSGIDKHAPLVGGPPAGRTPFGGYVPALGHGYRQEDKPTSHDRTGDGPSAGADRESSGSTTLRSGSKDGSASSDGKSGSGSSGSGSSGSGFSDGGSGSGELSGSGSASGSGSSFTSGSDSGSSSGSDSGSAGSSDSGSSSGSSGSESGSTSTSPNGSSDGGSGNLLSSEPTSTQQTTAAQANGEGTGSDA